jgi:hypothetical protein
MVVLVYVVQIFIFSDETEHTNTEARMWLQTQIKVHRKDEIDVWLGNN